MSLSRYENREELIQVNEPQYGQTFTDADINILPHSFVIPDDPRFIEDSIAQVHIYSFYGDYIAGDHQATYLTRDPSTNSFLIDVADVFRQAEITRGSYLIAINIFSEVWGNPSEKTVVIEEISPDRTEVKLRIPDKFFEGGNGPSNFKQVVNGLASEDILNNLVVDFGFNRVGRILLVKFDKEDDRVIYLKLYKPLDDLVQEKELGWFGFEAIDSYIDTVILSAPVVSGPTNMLKGPNFDIDADQWASNATVFKSWNDLLDSDVPTTQRVIDASLSGSAIARLNIDYTSFENFIYYSSAEERLRNFKYKLELIEGYNSTISTLQNSTASNTVFISASVDTNQKRIDRLTTGFDSFERWLYYEGTGSLFTHDISGSLTPWPKYLSSGQYILHHTTSSIATDWFNTNIASASAYDELNYNRLWWSIPEHIVQDAGNEDYVTFVEMVGHHFDNIYSYIRALTQIHERDEHPERGPSNDLLWPIAKSFGWNLQNTRQLSDLWFYKLGTSASGSYENTGSLFSLTRENQTHQIWRRVVNNLPYLLKTKGTSRSVKAMMNVYGIPQTLISIKEYGGPSIENNKPAWIEDRFAYAIRFDGTQSISMDRLRIDSPVGSWHADGITRYVPDTIEFRFATSYSGSAPMTLFQVENNAGDENDIEIRLHHASEITGTGSYSGSRLYGRVELLYDQDNPGTVVSASTDYLPFFDGDMWTVRLWTEDPITPSTTTGSFKLEVGRAADCTFGDYYITGSINLTVNDSSADGSRFAAWGVTSPATSSALTIRLGGNQINGGISAVAGTGSYFSGSMQGYKEYFRKMSYETYKEHILNPSAYHLNEPTASYYSLYRYFPMGLDVIRYDHTATASISSSQPNRDINVSNVATFNNYTGGQEDQYRSFRETYYTYTPSIGGQNIRNNKMRIEEAQLTRDLTPSARAERAQFDLASYDTNRLAIVFSLADQVNRDIFNQFGFDELDHWIGDPEYEFNYEYSELKRFADEYWKKYVQKNDINAFIRILSVYDYTFFEQIRQLVPGRADLVAGILIEPNVLERPKAKLTKRPTVENPQYEQVIYYPLNQSGDYQEYETEISGTLDIDFTYSYNTGSLEWTPDLDIGYSYQTASLQWVPEVTASSLHHFTSIHQKSGVADTLEVYPNKFSGSQAPTQSVVDRQHISTTCIYQKVNYHYSSSNTITPNYLRQWYTAVSKSYGWYYSRSLEDAPYQINECSARNNSRFIGSKLTGPDINVDSSATIDGGPVVQVFESNPNTLSVNNGEPGGNLLVE